ncbi:hypothetical protein JK386_06320 [Nocardioides sp. zg-536]|uniref:Uncharacterized protein n=1 Tax=Nocardioides faecalis TaxID=2803858 RepID=A0A938Y094_9ACTN|nr:hypothetical protein [Nocardioides faecalis]MBM9459511.1 hypothetical protein [Nocardioides faecalis]QVI58049.1 hypothetical protein KG111_13615 [Nocardioides faecalis]
MFNRSRSTHDVDARRAELVASFDEAVGSFPSPPTEPAGSGELLGAGAGALPAQEHTETLRATRDAQQQAQQLLAVAAQARTEATEQAEQILLEARSAADALRVASESEATRIRRAASEWVQQQRNRVETTVAELLGAAEEDADRIRTEAMRNAMAEAEETARFYISEAAARGARDAEATRARARELLQRAIGLAGDVDGNLRDATATLTGLAGDLQGWTSGLERLLEEVRTHDAVGSRPTEHTNGAPTNGAPTSPPPFTLGAFPAPASGREPWSGAAGHAQVETGEVETGADETGEDGALSAPDHAGASEPQVRRQLGSLFRDSRPTG